jgi:hypothetical protein
MNKDSNLFKSISSDNTKLQITATTELTADNTMNKSYFTKVIAETS